MWPHLDLRGGDRLHRDLAEVAPQGVQGLPEGSRGSRFEPGGASVPSTYDKSFVCRRTAHNGPLCAVSMRTREEGAGLTGAEQHAEMR